MDTPHARLKQARTIAGLSQRELARLAHLASTHVGLIESGHVENPQTDTLCALARVLGCSLDWLLAGEGPPPTTEQVVAAIERAGFRVAPLLGWLNFAAWVARPV